MKEGKLKLKAIFFWINVIFSWLTNKPQNIFFQLGMWLARRWNQVVKCVTTVPSQVKAFKIPSYRLLEATSLLIKNCSVMFIHDCLLSDWCCVLTVAIYIFVYGASRWEGGEEMLDASLVLFSRILFEYLKFFWTWHMSFSEGLVGNDYQNFMNL